MLDIVKLMTGRYLIPGNGCKAVIGSNITRRQPMPGTDAEDISKRIELNIERGELLLPNKLAAGRQPSRRRELLTQIRTAVSFS